MILRSDDKQIFVVNNERASSFINLFEDIGARRFFIWTGVQNIIVFLLDNVFHNHVPVLYVFFHVIIYIT